MEIDKGIKKNVTEEWLKAFPELSPFTQNKLYKIIGCCIVGIELIKLPHSEEYRPYFVIYALWKNDVKNCLDAPVLMKQIYNEKRLQFNIPYTKHATYFNDAVECLKNQIPISLYGNVTLKSLLEFVSSLFNDMLVKTNSAEQAKLFELEFNSALYTGSKPQVQNLLTQIQKESKCWNMQMFEMRYGKVDLWLQGLVEKANNREGFLALIKINKRDQKIKQLKRSDLLL